MWIKMINETKNNTYIKIRSQNSTKESSEQLSDPSEQICSINFEEQSIQDWKIVDFDGKNFLDGNLERLHNFIQEMSTKFQSSKFKDDFRAPIAAKEGGFILTDEELLTKYRNAFKDLIA